MHNPHKILILTTLLGAIGLWLLLPRGTHRGRAIGMLLATIALAVGASELPLLGEWLAESLFGILATVTIVSAVAAITFRNPVYCALWFGLTLLGTAGLFLFAGAQFPGRGNDRRLCGCDFGHLPVCADARAAGRQSALRPRELGRRCSRRSPARSSWAFLSMTFVGVFANPNTSEKVPLAAPSQEKLEQGVLVSEHVAALGGELFGKHLIAIEVAGTLLFAAIVGAAVIVNQSKIQPK